MDNRNVKIIDENNIDREGKVICGFSDNENKYVLYYISRDEDNDNLFDSKIITKLDGTSSMVNIEDSAEKERVDDLAKKLVKYAIDTDSDILNQKTVSIDNKSINIDSVLFNKEQNINVSKTYVATVKRNVSKVAFDFFKPNDLLKENNSVFEVNDNSIFANVGAQSLPEQPLEPNMVNTAMNIVEPKIEEVKQEEVVAPVLEAPQTLIQEQKEEVVATPSVPTEVTPVIPVVVQPNLPVQENVEVKKEEVAPVANVQPEAPVLEQNKVETTPDVLKQEVKTEPIPVTPVPVLPTEPAVMPVLEPEPKLFFDGSKESNLNSALGETSDDKVVKTDDNNVESLREFGTSDKPANNLSSQNISEPEVSNVKTLTRSKGFASNKFFTVVAIVLFLAACVFLGYEAFQYFTMTK